MNASDSNLNAFPDFTLGISGDGIALDPDGGALTISAAALVAGLGFTITRRDATGVVTDAFRVTLRLGETAEETAVAPALLAAPALAGAGLVGQPVTLDPGAWSGTPAPELGIVWLRDGVEIPDAAGESYLPVAADDGAHLSARVTARNAAGTARAETGTLAITEVAPSALGGLADLTLTKGSGTHRIETAGAFAGARLGYSVTGPGTGGGAVIDPATGALDLPRDTLRAAERVTVTARNSGGAAEVGFLVTVVPAIARPEVAGAIADQTYPLGEGTRTISTQAHFTGEDLVYALEAAPPGVTIQPGSGLVSVATGAALDGTVTVRAENAGGAATLSFRVVVRAMATVFSEAAALTDLSFLATEGAPALSFDARGFAKLVPAATGRTHGAWAKAAGAGLYRMLVRWSSPKPSAAGGEPFVFGMGVALADGNLTGAFVEIHRPADVAARGLRVLEYTGAGVAATERAAVAAAWSWDTLYWLEVEMAGGRVRARFYPEAGPAPDWMIAAEVAVPALGAFGPGAIPLAGVSPTVLVKRIEFSPIEPGTPAAARDADWSLAQVTEQAHD